MLSNLYKEYNTQSNFTQHMTSGSSSSSSTVVTGIPTSTSIQSLGNNIGVTEGIQAAKTSMKDTYVHYNGHIFKIPEGAVEQYNSDHVFTGYKINGKIISVDDMMKMT